LVIKVGQTSPSDQTNLTLAQDNPTPTLSEVEGVRIDVSSFAPGVYFVQAGGNVGKFVIVK
ncbi:MAG: hypothetical protein QG635_1367, partial [Bacteroidota bacterium]|nr:hypothetical protein [Bacteroidota bacterium]